MVQINLLPWREHQRQLKRAMFGVLLAGFFVLSIFIIILIHIHIDELTSIQTERNQFLQTAITNAQTEITSLKQKKIEQIKLLISLRFILNLRVKSFETVSLLDTLAKATPSSMVLEKVVRENSTVTISGFAQTDNDVTVLMKNITQAQDFTQPVLTEISSQDTAAGPLRHFTIKIDEKG